MTKLGFIGLGRMGAGMAHNLLRAGYSVAVHDLDRELGREAEAEGATWAESIAHLAAEADIVLTSLPGPQQMQEVARKENGLLTEMRPGTVWFDLSTNSPSVVREVGAECRDHDVQLLDAPVSGGPAGAASGKLALYVGGDRAAFDAHRGVLDAMGDKVVYVGEVGAGSIAKLVHNCASITIRQSIAEVLSMGVKAGVEPAELWHAVRQGAIGRSRTFDKVKDRYLQEAYEPANFALELANKDLRLALELADEFDVPMRAARLAQEDFAEALDKGWGHLDSQSPLRLQNERAGVTIKLTAEEVEDVIARG